MASEIRVDKITSLSGVGTITPSPTGIDISGITTVATLKATTGIVTTLTATTGIVTTLTANTVTSLGAVSGTTGTFSGDVDIADTIVHTGDTNTKIRFPAADTITAETGGSERFRIGSGGDVSVGGHSTNYADSPLEVRGTNAGGDVAIRVTNNSTTAGTQAGVIFTTTTSDFTTAGIAYERGGTADALRFYVGQSDAAGGFDNATERLRIDSNGKIGVGGAPSAWQAATTTNALQIGNACLFNYNDTFFHVGQNFYYDGSNYKFINNGYATRLLQNAGEFTFLTSDASGSADGNVNFQSKVRITPAGDVDVEDGDIFFSTADKGIVLGATSNTDANTLDDYEEGSFTPSADAAGGVTFSYNHQYGFYTKIGDTVTFQLYMMFHASTITSGNEGNGVVIQGLPFTIKNHTRYNPAFTIGRTYNFDIDSDKRAYAYGDSNSTNIRIIIESDDTVGAVLTAQQVDRSPCLTFITGVYKI